MRVKDKELEFEWDKGNLGKNSRKHNVTSDEAESVFGDENSVVLSDEKHSVDEVRYAIFGKSDLNRYLYIVFTMRGNKVRIISARRMHRKEVEKYVKVEKNTQI